MILVVGQNSAWQKTYRLAGISRGAVNRVGEVIESAAGKGTNTCRALTVYGMTGELHAYVGGPNGRKFAQACHADGLTARFSKIRRETRVCTTLIEEDATMTELVEPAPEISAAERERAHALLLRRLRRASMLAICGTAMTGESDDCYLSFVHAAREAGVPVILDSYRLHGRLALGAAPEILKINRDEFTEIAEMPVESAQQRIAAFQAFTQRYGLRWIVITHGKHGAEGYNGTALVHVSPPRVSVLNPIGSGDSVTAGIIAGISRAASTLTDAYGETDVLRTAVIEGVSAGTANCMNLKPGHIEAQDLDWVRKNCSVETVRLG